MAGSHSAYWSSVHPSVVHRQKKKKKQHNLTCQQMFDVTVELHLRLEPQADSFCAKHSPSLRETIHTFKQNSSWVWRGCFSVIFESSSDDSATYWQAGEILRLGAHSAVSDLKSPSGIQYDLLNRPNTFSPKWPVFTQESSAALLLSPSSSSVVAVTPCTSRGRHTEPAGRQWTVLLQWHQGWSHCSVQKDPLWKKDE